MKKAILIWHTETIAGENIGGLFNFGKKKVAKKYLERVNEQLKKENICWEIILDDTYADPEKIKDKSIDLIIMTPAGKMRSWMYIKDLEKIAGPIYHLEYSEFYTYKIDKLCKYISGLIK